VVPSAERPCPDCIDPLRHEYAPGNAWDGGQALRPLELFQRGRPILVFEDRGGEALERLIGPPMETGCFAATLGGYELLKNEKGKGRLQANARMHPLQDVRRQGSAAEHSVGRNAR
jgi:hypothetical protein